MSTENQLKSFVKESFELLKNDTKIKKLHKSLYHFSQLLVGAFLYTLAPFIFTPLCLMLELEGVNSNTLFYTTMLTSFTIAFISVVLLKRSANDVTKKLYRAQDRFERKHSKVIIDKGVKALFNQLTTDKILNRNNPQNSI